MGREAVLDTLTIALCISIGTGVPWLIALQSEPGARQLIENSVFGLIGTVLGALAFDWISPTYSIIVLILAGPVVALLAIVGGQALKRMLMKSAQPPG
jgi:hypothetical protein